MKLTMLPHLHVLRPWTLCQEIVFAEALEANTNNSYLRPSELREAAR